MIALRRYNPDAVPPIEPHVLVRACRKDAPIVRDALRSGPIWLIRPCIEFEFVEGGDDLLDLLADLLVAC